MIKFLSVVLNNYGSYVHQEFSFTPGKHAIVGCNGQGKSTVLESLVWVLYKDANRGKNPSHFFKGNCFVEVHLSIDGKSYCVTRFYDHATEGNGLKIMADGEDISCRLIKDTEEVLSKIGLPSYDLFATTIVILQGIPVNFSKFSPTQRKDLLESMLGFELWDELRDKAKKEIKELTVLESDLITKITAQRELVIKKDAGIESTKKLLEQAKDDYDKELAELRTQYKTVNETKLINESELAKELGKYKSLSELSIELALKQSNLGSTTRHIRELNNLLTQTHCPTCGQVLPKTIDTEATKKKIIDLEASLTTDQEDIKLLQDKNASITGANTRLTEINTTLKNIVANAEAVKKKMEKPAITPVDILLAEQIPLKQKLQKLIDEQTVLTIKINNFKYVDNLLTPSSRFRAMVLEQYLDTINQILKKIIPIVFPELTASLELDSKGRGIDVRMERLNVKGWGYDNLSGGQKKRLDVILILALQRFQLLHSGISSNILGFDEIFDALDDEGVESVINCIDSLYGDEICVYIISQIKELKNLLNSVITITYKDGVSELNI